MDYNAGYDVKYYGYVYKTGCIDFPKNKWKDEYIRRKIEKMFFAYIKVNDDFVGYVNYHYNKNDNRYDCGIVIEASKRSNGYAKIGLKLLCDRARKNRINSLYNNFEINRGSALEVFKSVGFKVIEKSSLKKFEKENDGVIIVIDLKK